MRPVEIPDVFGRDAANMESLKLYNEDLKSTNPNP